MDEPKKAAVEIEGDMRNTWWYVCEECHGEVNPNQTRCGHCGAELIWDDGGLYGAQKGRNKHE